MKKKCLSHIFHTVRSERQKYMSGFNIPDPVEHTQFESRSLKIMLCYLFPLKPLQNKSLRVTTSNASISFSILGFEFFLSIHPSQHKNLHLFLSFCSERELFRFLCDRRHSSSEWNFRMEVEVVVF